MPNPLMYRYKAMMTTFFGNTAYGSSIFSTVLLYVWWTGHKRNFFLFLMKLESKPVEFWNGIKSCKTDHSFQQQPKECIDFKKADWLHFASGCEAKKNLRKKINSGVHGSQICTVNKYTKHVYARKLYIISWLWF